MRKVALVLALAVAVAPTAALAAKKKPAKAPAAKAAKATKAAKGPVDLNANGRKFVMTAFSQPYLAWKSVWAPDAAPAKGKKK